MGEWWSRATQTTQTAGAMEAMASVVTQLLARVSKLPPPPREPIVHPKPSHPVNSVNTKKSHIKYFVV